jgi:hypothetical protein
MLGHLGLIFAISDSLWNFEGGHQARFRKNFTFTSTLICSSCAKLVTYDARTGQEL